MQGDTLPNRMRRVLDWTEQHPEVRMLSIMVTDYDDPSILLPMVEFRSLFAGQSVRRRVSGDTAHYRITVDGVELRAVEPACIAEQRVDL